MADAWRKDLKLREDMERYVRQGLKREEALDFLKRDFPMYPWSIRSLERRLRCFEIYYNNPEVSLYDLDPEGLEARGGIGAKKKRKKGNF